jgi:asparagine synthase (glutamine-hydrolysing)
MGRSVMAPTYRERYADCNGAVADQFCFADQLDGRDRLNQSLYLWSKSVLPNYILVLLGDRMEMAHSVEGRLPFLDHHVVEYICKLPVDLKIRGETEKYILRKAVRPVTTETAYLRRKKAFVSPRATGRLNGRFYQFLQDTLRGPALRSVPFYDPKAVVGLLDALPGMSPEDRILWDPLLTSILSASVLQARYHLG